MVGWWSGLIRLFPGDEGVISGLTLSLYWRFFLAFNNWSSGLVGPALHTGCTCSSVNYTHVIISLDHCLYPYGSYILEHCVDWRCHKVHGLSCYPLDREFFTVYIDE